MSGPLETLARAYADPIAYADALRSQGRRIVGLVGAAAPVELIIAAGLHPLALTGTSEATPDGDRFMESFFDPEYRFVFDRLLTGGFGPLEAAVVSRMSDQHNKLYLYLREVARLGHGAKLPPVELYDMLHSQTPRSQAYGLERTRELAARLAEISGRPVDQDDLRSAISQVNGARQQMARLLEMRTEASPRIQGSDAFVALGAYRFMEAGVYADTLRQWLDQAASPLPPAPRLLVRGLSLTNPDLHRLVEEAGARVVAEDDPWGSRAAMDPIEPGDDPLAAVFDAYHRQTPSIRVEPRAARDAWFHQQVESGQIEGVIVVIPPIDDALGWDLPTQTNWLDARGVNSLVLRSDGRFDADRPAILSALKSFVQTLKTPA